MILVVGATGDLGSLITDNLVQRGEQVRVLNRQVPALVDRCPGVQKVTGDLKESASLLAACAGVHTVITTANAASRAAPDTIDSVDLAGNLNLIAAAEEAGVQRFVFVSALGAAPDHPMPLLRAKGRSEQRLRSSAMAWTILQPDVFMDRLVPIVVGEPALANRQVTLVGEGRRHHSFVAMRDVAAYAVAVLQHPEAHHETIHIGGPTPLSWHDVIAAFEHELDRPVPVSTVPAGQPVTELPHFVTSLLTALEGYDSPVDMTQAASTYRVEPTDLATFVHTFVSAAQHPVPS